jgi:uncharacterized protein YijF (DUF1287 family)
LTRRGSQVEQGHPGVKKNNGRRKAAKPRKKDRKHGSGPAPARPILAAAQHEMRRSPALSRIDWPALAILIVPLTAMALLFQPEPRVPTKPMVALRPPPEIGVRAPPEVTIGPPPAPVEIAASPSVAARSPEPAPQPRHDDDLAIEDRRTSTEPESHTHVMPDEAQPAPWHGDLALEAMPLFPEPTNHWPAAPVSGRVAAMAKPDAICLPDDVASAAAPLPAIASLDPARFGRAVAQAARTQTDGFLIYNPRYVTLAYPRGDTPPLYGVCTDVVIRAYRALGIDFQELIHTARVGRGDPSIDHRRVEIIRRFLERHGTKLETSEFAEDYRPGDIVTYHRPEGRTSQHHIAIVSDVMAPSGRPLVVHNRGWGPQLEDALFADQITGHYRFTPGHLEAYLRSRLPRAADRAQRSTPFSVAARR